MISKGDYFNPNKFRLKQKSYKLILHINKITHWEK